MSAGPRTSAQRGHVDPELTRDFPRLALWSIQVASAGGRTPRSVRRRLDHLTDRMPGLVTGGLRTNPVLGAYRAFARQLGLDPDADRLPLEQAAFERLLRGRFVSRGWLSDAVLLAMFETGVPLWSVDAASLEGPLRVEVDDTAGAAVVDHRGVVAPLMGAPVRPELGTRPGVASVFAVRVEAVPSTTVDEALWLTCEMLDQAR
ncbi:MAG TPA: hypothetical protein VD931_10660 [Baekduia sp.]|nr:hypothetical protein [Baekduia sp.]